MKLSLETVSVLDPMTRANLRSRPARTLATTLGIALGVGLILLTAGLANGLLSDAARRQSSLGAELLFQPPGSFSANLTATPLSLPVAYASALAQLDKVQAATPVGRFVQSGAQGLGFELIEGTLATRNGDIGSYAEITGLTLSEGRMPETKDEVIVDSLRASREGAGLGERIELLGHEFVVVGVFDPPIGARVKMSLEAMQDLLGSEDKCSWILVKLRSPLELESAATEILNRFPGNQVLFTRDIPSFMEQGIPSLDVFLRVVLGLGLVVSALMTLVTMYTAVLERTREIGLLKAMGAPTRFTLLSVLKEALALGVLGTTLGVGLALVARRIVVESTTLLIEFSVEWILAAIAVAFLSTLLGSIYPAVRAAALDPIEALSHE